jgi:predicted transcriptional regulator
MVELVRRGRSMYAVARQFHVSSATVWRWVERARGKRLDRVLLASRKPGRAWNRTASELEGRILQVRQQLRETSVLGEYGARAIEAALQCESPRVPSLATISRVLVRHGAVDRTRRLRRPPPPKGWYLPALAAGQAELDSFDWIEDLKIAGGPLVQVLTGVALWGCQPDAWPQEAIGTESVLSRLSERWQELGLPAYAQFDNEAVFQGAHHVADTVGQVSRLCLALGVTPVFAPPYEHGFQNAIESFNGLWQSKVWRRHRFEDLAHLQAASARYIAAHRARSAKRHDDHSAPRRAFPQGFSFDVNTPLTGTLIFVRRTDEAGRAHLLGRAFPVADHWAHRLVRAEVRLDAHEIRFYALRRKAPADQPLLNEVPYHREHKPFRGKPWLFR